MTKHELKPISPDNKDRAPESQRQFSPDYTALMKSEITSVLLTALEELGVADIKTAMAQIDIRTVPKDQSGDLGFPCFTLAKALHLNPKDIALQLEALLSGVKLKYIKKFEASGSYLNAYIDYQRFGSDQISSIIEAGPNYGSENIGQGSHYVIDMSSPNIAKPMSVGHLRSTIIGDALANCLDFMGYKVTKDNHLGDWGTQFGYLMLGIEKYGALENIETSNNPVVALKDIYVNITAESKTDETVVKGARKWFLRLEQGDPEARDLWQKIVDWSIAEFERVYKRLGVTFDVWLGESFYENMLDDAVEFVKQSGAATISEGAVIVDQRNPYNRLVAQWSPDLGILLAGLEQLEETEGLKTNLWQTLQSAYQTGKQLQATDPQAVAVIKEQLETGRTKQRDAIMNIFSLLLAQEQTEEGQSVNLSSILAGLFDKESIKRESIEVTSEKDFSGKDSGVQIIRKSDGASLYATRDLATALYREKELHADGMIYVVGGEQQLYFQQFFELLRRIGHPLADKSHHVWFGMVKGVSIDPVTGFMTAEKMSTRKGTTILLEDVINEAEFRARALMKSGEKTKLTEEEQAQVVEQVAVGALKWNDLKSDPRRDILFNWDEMLTMIGDSAPYVMYSRARALGLLEKAGRLDEKSWQSIHPEHQLEKDLVLKLSQFSEAIKKAVDSFSLAPLASYIYELSQMYNAMYNGLPILNARQGESLTQTETNTRLALSAATAQTIENGLRLLGIDAPDRM